MSSEEVLLLNAVVYTLTLVYFFMKYRMSVGVIIWALYTVSAWSSFFFIQQPGYVGSTHDSEQTILPCIYLYVVFMIAMTPLMKLDKIESIDFFNKRLLKWIMAICTIIQFAFFIIDIPSMAEVITSGSAMLNELRSTVYGNEDTITRVTQNAWTNRISLLYSGIRIPATGLSVVTFFSFKDNRRLANLFALSALLNNLRIIITSVGRGEMVLVFLLYVCTVYLMRDWLSPKTKRRVILFSIPVVILGASFFMAITISRFGDEVTYFMFKYLGEPINNFNGILFKNIQGTTNGRAYFSLIYRYLFGEQDFASGSEKWSLIKEYTGIRGDIFYTWVGGLIIEFGKIAPPIVAIVLNRLLSKLSALRDYHTGDIFVLIFFVNFYLRGIFLFPTQNFEGMFMILYTVILYFMFRIHNKGGGVIEYWPPRPNTTEYHEDND